MDTITNKLIVLPVRNSVLFPGIMTSVTVTRERAKDIVRTAYQEKTTILVVAQKDDAIDEPTGDDLYDIGTTARVYEPAEREDGTITVMFKGIDRVRVLEYETTDEGFIATTQSAPEIQPRENDSDYPVTAKAVLEQAHQIIEFSNDPKSVAIVMRYLEAFHLSYMMINYICANFGMQNSLRQDFLNCDTITERAHKLLEVLNREVAMQRTRAEINTKTQADIDKDQRAYYLHHQLETIQKELGEDSGKEIIEEMKLRAEKKQWSDEVKALFDKALEKLQRMSKNNPDYSSQQNYLDLILELPWNEVTRDNFDIRHAREVLDEDHYGLDKVKERIIEYLAVLKMRNDMKSPIICLYGPPGVGKTSLGRSVARALERKYARISLGGLHDEAEIRGHRKTYIGALPGRIIDNIRKVQSSNPVFVLDEIDKIGADYKGDPTSALLEVLDPEQNSTFHDNYLDIDYDLSKVLFIATANSLDSIPRPLLDRMELIEMTGYCIEEKQEIAIRHLIPKQIKEHGLTEEQISFPLPTLTHLIDDYTRESGVRSLERQIGAVCRKVVTKIVLEEPYTKDITEADLITYLGKARYTRDIYEGNRYVGVVTGLAWTSVGGEILFIETSLSPAKTPTLTLTGNLGDVMKESATIALAYIKAHAADFGIPQKEIDTHSVHLHVPEGAIPKDGPSAGITMMTALVSAFTKRKVNPRIAMTGEMTLRGKVLPIGGVKEKMLAAKRAGITDLIFCEDNRKDVEDIPEMYRIGLTFHYVNDIHEVIDLALS